MQPTVKKYPILFSDAMILAILENRKDQTRRTSCLEFINEEPENWQYEGVEDLTETGHGIRCVMKNKRHQSRNAIKSPFGQPGDILWVRENHFRFGHWFKNGQTKKGKQKYTFVPDNEDIHYSENPPETYFKGRSSEGWGFPAWYKRNARFMPYTSARLFLEVKSMRIERLKDIESPDCYWEGIQIFEGETFVGYTAHAQAEKDYINSYLKLWMQLNGQKSLDENHWVWVIKFKRAEKP